MFNTKVNDKSNAPRQETQAVAELESRLVRAMDAYREWRRKEADPYSLAENMQYLQRIDRLRREIASAKASAEDIVAKMRLLDNWSDPEEGGKSYQFSTAQGDYKLTVSDVTHVWLVRTPDNALEGPFKNAQEAADWAADDWGEIFSRQSSSGY